MSLLENHDNSDCERGGRNGTSLVQDEDATKELKVKAQAIRPWSFRKCRSLQKVTLKILRWEERDKRLVIKEAQFV